MIDSMGRSLAATLGLLGLYQEEQERVYQEIAAVLSDGREPVSEIPIEYFSAVLVLTNARSDLGRF